MKIRTVGDKLFYADGQTDMTKVKVALRNSVHAPNKHWFSVTKLPIKKTFQKATQRQNWPCTRHEDIRRSGGKPPVILYL
jgi:hypothetical protein